MAQSLELNIKTTSDVPQAMDKAKKATDGFGKQVDDIQKKFSTAFKDIALGFVAPIILLNKAITPSPRTDWPGGRESTAWRA